MTIIPPSFQTFIQKLNDCFHTWQGIISVIVLLGVTIYWLKPEEGPRVPQNVKNVADKKIMQGNSASGLLNAAEGAAVETTASIMSPAKTDLDPPKDTPITPSELAKNVGPAPTPIWVAIKGSVFDVSAKADMYGPGGGYSIFAGKDGSVGLGKTSLKIEDARPDYQTLEPAELKTLDGWYDFFSKRYNIVGKVAPEKDDSSERLI